jgi:hypothetical protein
MDLAFLPQPHARLIAVRELDAGGFEGQNDLRDRMAVRRLVSVVKSLFAIRKIASRPFAASLRKPAAVIPP